MKKIAINLFVFILIFSPFIILGGGPNPTQRMNTIFTNIGNWLYSFLIAGAVIAIIIGAFNILLSGGDPGKANSGKMIIIYALVAIIVASLARGVVNEISQW